MKKTWQVNDIQDQSRLSVWGCKSYIVHHHLNFTGLCCAPLCTTNVHCALRCIRGIYSLCVVVCGGLDLARLRYK